MGRRKYGATGYLIVEQGWQEDTGASRKAAELARQISALLQGPGTLFFLGQAALVAVVSGRPGRTAFEALLGEKVPDSLWREIRELGEATRKMPTSKLDGAEADQLVAVLGGVALACVAERSGGRARLEKRLARPLTDREWASVQAHVKKERPRFQRNWQGLRKTGGVSLPSSLREL